MMLLKTLPKSFLWHLIDFLSYLPRTNLASDLAHLSMDGMGG